MTWDNLPGKPRERSLTFFATMAFHSSRLATGAQTRMKCHRRDRKSTRLNSSHGYISYAVFCLKKKKSLKWLETNNLFNNLIQRNQSAAFSSGKVRPNHETNINIIARRTGKDVNSHTVLDGIITTIMATIQRINIIFFF